MASAPPAVLILGHSFVRRLSSDLKSNFDARAAKHFNLLGDAVIHLHGVGGRTLKKFRLFVLGVVSALKPDVIILEIGANDLVADHPEVVGSEIDDLVQLLLQSSSVRVIGVCEVIPRVRAPFFNAAAPILNQYLTDVLQLCPNVFSWHRTGFSNPTVRPYLPDGVHLNPQGQYSLYRSYRGTILKALRSLRLAAFFFWHCLLDIVVLSPCCSGLYLLEPLLLSILTYILNSSPCCSGI